MDGVAAVLKYSGTLLIYFESSSAKFKVSSRLATFFSSVLCIFSDYEYFSTALNNRLLSAWPATGPDIVRFFGDALYHLKFVFAVVIIVFHAQSLADIFNCLGSKNHKQLCNWPFKLFMLFYFCLIISFNSVSYNGFALTKKNMFYKLACFVNDVYNCSIFLLMNYILVALRNTLLQCNTRVGLLRKCIREEKIHSIRNFRANLLIAQERFISKFSLLLLVVLGERSIYVQIQVYYLTLAVHGRIFHADQQNSSTLIVQYCSWLLLDMCSVCALVINCVRVESEVKHFLFFNTPSLFYVTRNYFFILMRLYYKTYTLHKNQGSYNVFHSIN